MCEPGGGRSSAAKTLSTEQVLVARLTGAVAGVLEGVVSGVVAEGDMLSYEIERGARRSRWL